MSMSNNFSAQYRIYYEDTDAGGVVYHANYLKFAERGRTELLRFLGFENKSLQDKEGVLFVVWHLEADYIKPAFLDDRMELETSIVQLKNASVIMKQIVIKNGEPVCTMNVVLVCIDKHQHKPVGIPQDIRQKFETFMKENS